jgi:hypothetical protein
MDGIELDEWSKFASVNNRNENGSKQKYNIWSENKIAKNIPLHGIVV